MELLFTPRIDLTQVYDWNSNVKLCLYITIFIGCLGVFQSTIFGLNSRQYYDIFEMGDTRRII